MKAPTDQLDIDRAMARKALIEKIGLHLATVYFRVIEYIVWKT